MSSGNTQCISLTIMEQGKEQRVYDTSFFLSIVFITLKKTNLCLITFLFKSNFQSSEEVRRILLCPPYFHSLKGISALLQPFGFCVEKVQWVEPSLWLLPSV